MRRTTTPTLTAFSVAVLAPLAALNAAEQTSSVKPNIVFILADDWGWGDLTCHGNKFVETPNLDRLAREGTEFYQFHVGGPTCSPSRVAFVTGRFPARYRVHDGIGGSSKNREHQQVDWLDPSAPTIMRLLKQAGYVTGHFGKWHLGGPFRDAPLPAAYGVDEHAIWTGPKLARQTDHRKVFDDAIAFIRAHRTERFYVNLWVHQTHLPHFPSKEAMAKYASLGKQQQVYSAVVADGDQAIGRVLSALDDFGLKDKTLVIFSSDNGPENIGGPNYLTLQDGLGGYYNAGSTGGMHGRKRSLYEGGLHVPFIVRWPGHVPAAKVNRTTHLAAVDLLPTLCALTGVAVPDDPQIDGENLLLALLGGERLRTKPLFWDWNGTNRPGHCWPRWGVRDGNWKLVTDGSGRTELYRLPEDWAEAKDMAKGHPDVVARLTAALDAWRALLSVAPSPQFISSDNRGK